MSEDRGLAPTTDSDRRLQSPLGRRGDWNQPVLHFSLASRSLLVVAFELTIATVLITAWIIDHPGSDEYDSTDTMFMVALLSMFAVGLGWQFLGGWGLAVGFTLQVAGLVWFISLLGVSMAAYNPHMDNWCNDIVTGTCVRNAQRWYHAIYGMYVGAALISAAAVAWKRHAWVEADGP